ncbi:Ger(x)C family spore germination protein [Paenibacillus sp. LHD-117]|uniref:Ger(x)C family spore germination protein n=1 Tax=Paenibacillus sp. LHD-117 TaxID=3071412 RepID=UPI0027E128B0|nr:Ger(x)C family spore germination protein [Paenibacillus sp. LHD-117]MDQ6418799.1 Ger(x)C family spore germination protein [Paenibacillus sp. LHD-117]
MTRKTAMFMLLLIVLPIATGCWNRRELNDLAIVAGLGIDIADGKYLVTVQVVDPGEVAAGQGTSGRSPVTTFHAKGNTIFEAIRKMTTVTPRKLYFAHLRIMVIGEKLARKGIGEALDLLSRDQEGRTDFYIVVAKGTTAHNIVNVLTPMEKIPATKMYTSLEVSEKAWAPSVSVQLDQLITAIVSPGIQPVLTGISIQGNVAKGKKQANVDTPDTDTHLQYKGIAVFRGDKLVGWLNEAESKGYSNITDRLTSTVIETSCPKGGKLGIEIIRSQAKINGKVKGGKPEAEVVIYTEANVADVECKIDLTKTNTLYDLEKKTEQVLIAHNEQALKKAKKLKCDIFGFGEAVHRADPGYWKAAKNDWGKIFAELPVQFRVEVKIRRIGTVGDSFLNDLKE